MYTYVTWLVLHTSAHSEDPMQVSLQNSCYCQILTACWIELGKNSIEDLVVTLKLMAVGVITNKKHVKKLELMLFSVR